MNFDFHACLPYCDGQKYMLMENAHVIDCLVRDDCPSLDEALEAHKRILEHRGYRVIRYWPEPDYKPQPFLLNVITLRPASPATYTKYPPYLFLVKEGETNEFSRHYWKFGQRP